MGSIKYLKRARNYGKVDTSLDKKLENVEWGEFKIGELFKKLDLKFKKQIFDKKNDVSTVRTSEFDLPLVNAKNGNNGIMYYGRSKDFDSADICIDIVNDGAISTGNVYPQPKQTGVLYNAYLIKSKVSINEKILFFFAPAIQKAIKYKYGYENKASWEKVKKEKIKLPTKNGKIDFEFMENFIAELETQRVKKLDNYLEDNNLKDYTLTDEEKQVLSSFENGKIEFEKFKVIDIFNVKNSGNILSRDIVENSGHTPYLCASADNNSVSSYIVYDEKYIDKGNCVFIGGKTFVVSYQEQDFYSNDSHNLILSLKSEEEKNRLSQLCLVACVNKSLSYKYSWGNSISNRKIQKDRVSLPIKNNKPNYKIMNTLISAIQKQVIKDVVLYVDKKLGKSL